MHRTIQTTYRLAPTAEQEAQLRRFAGARRFDTQRVPELGLEPQAGTFPTDRQNVEVQRALCRTDPAQTATRNRMAARDGFAIVAADAARSRKRLSALLSPHAEWRQEER